MSTDGVEGGLRVGGWVPPPPLDLAPDADGTRAPSDTWAGGDAGRPCLRRFWIEPWYAGRRRARSNAPAVTLLVVVAVGLAAAAMALGAPAQPGPAMDAPVAGRPNQPSVPPGTTAGTPVASPTPPSPSAPSPTPPAGSTAPGAPRPTPKPTTWPVPPPVTVGVLNGGFETGRLSPWTCSGGLGRLVTYPVHSGQFALAGAVSNSDTAQCSQTASVRPGHRYTLSAWVRGVYVFIGATGTGTSDVSTWTPGGSSYTLLCVSFTTGSGTSSVTVWVHGWYAQGGYLADDITLG